MGSKLLVSFGSFHVFLKPLTKTFTLALFLLCPGLFVINDTLSAADQYRLEGQAGLPHAGRVKKKVQVMSFEATTEPMRAGAANTGTVSSGASRWQPRNTYEYVEMKPLVFLQLDGDYRHCVMAEAPKGRFKIDGLKPGIYKLTFAIPDLGYMEKIVNITADAADKDGKIKVEFDFEAKGASIEPVEREDVSKKAAEAFEKGAKEFSKNNGKKAFNEFEKAVKESPHYAEAWEHMGMIQHTEGNLDDAEKFFRKSLEIDPNSFRALADLGTILLVKGDPSGARSLYEKAVLIRPEEPQPRAQLGMALFQLQEMALAIDQLVKARTIDPKHFSQPQILSAEIFRLWGDGAGMAAELEDFLENFPDDPKAPAIKQALESIGR